MAALLRIAAVSKSFPGVQALDGVTFDVEAGSVHAVMGENGAGKSTLMQIVAGVIRPDGGSLAFEGDPLDLRSTRDAAARGIAIVFQELNLAPNMTVAENISLGIEPSTAGIFIDRVALRARAAGILTQLGIGLNLDARVGDLTIAQQQLIEICKSLVQTPRLLILDEPTSSLSETETNLLFRVIANLKASGVTMLYISHRMREVFLVCDTVTILRDGKHVRTMPLAATNQEEIVRLMVGRDLAGIAKPAADDRAGPVVLAVRGLTDGRQYQDITFELRRGEIVGLAGLVGAGRSEMALGIFGAPVPQSGDISLDGKAVHITGPGAAMKLGIALVPEDRKQLGLVLGLGVGSNVSLSALTRLSHSGLIDFAAEDTLIGRYISRFRIKTPTREQFVGLLSGGNQQKVVLAKWLATHPRVLIVDEPTRGVDVGTKAEIYALMRELALEGLAILMISSDLPEILAVSDRILIMRQGRLVGELAHADASEERIMAFAALEHAEPAAR